MQPAGRFSPKERSIVSNRAKSPQLMRGPLGRSAREATIMRIRTLARHGLVLFGGFLAGSRLVDATQAWREWHQWSVTDPSAADLYRTNFWIDIVVVVLVLGVAGLTYRLLRPSTDIVDKGA
jgi:hypothetical protein